MNLGSTTLTSGSLSGTNITDGATSSLGGAKSSASASIPTSGGHSDGALAGAIVGSVVGTAALTLLGAFLFFRRPSFFIRNQKRRSRSYTHSSSGSRRGNPGSMQTRSLESGLRTSVVVANRREIEVPHRAAAPASIIDRYVPQPADDRSVIRRVRTLFDNVALHVENYYPLTSESFVSIPDTTLLSDYNSPFLPASVASLMSDPKNVGAVLKHCIARTILMEMLPLHPASSQPPRGGSFLPRLCSLYTNPRISSPDEDQAFFYWRMLATHIQRELLKQESSYLTERSRHIERVVDALITAFAPYATSQYSSADRSRQLVEVMTSAAGLAFWVFGQPCGFEFIWSSKSADNSITLFPEMVKTFDEEGRRLPVAQSMIKMVIGQVQVV